MSAEHPDILDVVGRINGGWAGYGPAQNYGKVVWFGYGPQRRLGRIVSDSGILVGVCDRIVVVADDGNIYHVYPCGWSALAEWTTADRLCIVHGYCTPSRELKVAPYHYDVRSLIPA